MVRGRDDLGLDRPGAGLGDAGLDGRLHGDARQRRHPGDAAPGEGGRRGQGLDAGADAAAAVHDRRSSPRSCRRSATACGWSSTRAARAAAPGSERARCRGQDRHRAGDLEPGRAGRGQEREGPARQRLVRVLRPARQPDRSPASCSSSTASTARTRRRVAHHILDTFFAKQDGKPLPPPPTHEDLRLDYKDPMRTRRLRRAGE